MIVQRSWTVVGDPFHSRPVVGIAVVVDHRFEHCANPWVDSAIDHVSWKYLTIV